ncbi:hypothetical protein UFOVP1382_64 [uncultured Caudovirales phage]|uniref:Uncharacterized protein n=1 Tax=uncultured Caudovirales phage TaxID=2100421 RepID=A0A6J5S3B4_9CAUD|nr:hypothetical protein UFOVP1382_64 [uncultured Caudovirales phage]
MGVRVTRDIFDGKPTYGRLTLAPPWWGTILPVRWVVGEVSMPHGSDVGTMTPVVCSPWRWLAYAMAQFVVLSRAGSDVADVKVGVFQVEEDDR